MSWPSFVWKTTDWRRGCQRKSNGRASTERVYLLRERREKYNEIDKETHETMRIYVGEKNFNQKLLHDGGRTESFSLTS